MSNEKTALISCPLCETKSHSPWGIENNYNCVRCDGCGILYVNPRPSSQHIDKAVQLGVHSAEQLDVVGTRIASKVATYKTLISSIFQDVILHGKPISWLDVGAGFGELVEAVIQVAPQGSVIEGLEPMLPKVNNAKSRGLPMHAGYLDAIHRKYDFVSLIDVFSHIPDFKSFLMEVKSVLTPNGEVFLKTGNAADIGARCNFPGPLTLPDHLVFGGETHVIRFLEEAGFQIISIRRERIDGIAYSIRNVAKWILRRPVYLSFPYTSKSRTIFIRAKLHCETSKIIRFGL